MEYNPQLLHQLSVGPPKSWWTNNTILVRKKGKLNNYSLPNFDGKSKNQCKGLADYVKTFQTKTYIEISHYIYCLSFG